MRAVKILWENNNRGVIKINEYEKIELNKIYNEDCLEGMKRIEDKSIDMILCDIIINIKE